MPGDCIVARCLPPGLCMPPHTRRNGSPKAIIFGSRMPCLSCVRCLTCRFMVGVCDGVVPAWPVCSMCGYRGCDGGCVRVYGKGGGTCGVPSLSRFGCGGVLLSHTLPGAVPSPCQVLASGFGMGPGVSPGPWPPQIFNCHPTGHHARGGSWWVGDRIVDATEGLIHVTCRVSPCRPLSMFAPAALYGRVCVLPFDC